MLAIRSYGGTFQALGEEVDGRAAGSGASVASPGFAPMAGRDRHGKFSGKPVDDSSIEIVLEPGRDAVEEITRWQILRGGDQDYLDRTQVLLPGHHPEFVQHAVFDPSPQRRGN